MTITTPSPPRMANEAALAPLFDIAHAFQEDERIRVTASYPD